MKIFTFDTTLRDGTQGESVSFSVDDKLVIAQKLDELGIDYIEGGWPGSNPKDKEFFARAARAEAQARQAHRLRLHPLRQEPGGRGPQRAALWSRPARRWSPSSARRWDLHVTRALGITEEENLVADLRDRGATSRSTARKWSTTPSTSSTATSPIPITRCAPSKPRSRPAPTCSASATPTAAPSPAAWSRSSPRSAGASTASSASTPTTIATSPSPTPSPPSKPAPRTCRAA